MESSELESIRSRYREINDRIEKAARAAKRDPASITLIAVSKKQPIEKIETLYRLGHRDFGENYVQELVAKAGELQARGLGEIRWHLIGHLQTNKAKALIPFVASVHSVDSEKLAATLARQWATQGRPGKLPVFIEVNISAESSKSGMAAEEVPALVASLGKLSELELQGLMCVPAVTETPEGLRERFSQLRKLEYLLGDASKRRLSMGMSGDFELAIAEGATHIRVGTALFGSRL